ncbi:MAG: sigma-54-dependent transcriptional regulator [Gemmatimonadales bacterium]
MGKMPSGHILIVEDDDAQLRMLKTVLEADGWTVSATTSGEKAISILGTAEDVDVVLTDLLMPGVDGKAVLEAVRERRPEVPVIIMTAHASIDSAVELMQAGAHLYLEKPTKLPELRLAVRRARDATNALRELARLRRRVNMPADVVGVSRPMQELLETALKVAPTSTPVLITGEAGTGKEVVARAIHTASGRAAFVALNCAAIPPAAFETELFGTLRRDEKGEKVEQQGAVQAAQGGTLFLDEVSEVPLAAQPGLRHFLKDGQYQRAGSVGTEKSTARVIASTVRDLEEEVAAGRMREPLLYRLDIVRLHITPLRERPVDIPALAHHLLARLAERYQLEQADLAPETLAALTAYHWPGNIRELENVLARSLALRNGRTLTIRDLPPHIAKTAGVGARAVPGMPSAMLTLEEVERRHILQVLEKTGGNKLKAAEVLGIDRSTLHRKLKHIQGLAALQL